MATAGKALFLQKIRADATSGNAPKKSIAPHIHGAPERRSRNDQIVDGLTLATEAFLQKVAAASDQGSLKAKN